MDPLLESTAATAARLGRGAERPDEPGVAEIDLAIADEDQARAQQRTGDRPSLIARVGSIPQLLRWMGGAVLVAAAFVFMIQSWETGDDVGRYYHFLGFTGSLAAVGFFCGLRIGDEKSARTFLGLTAGMVPVHFTVLGAILYSQLPWLSGFTDYPGYAHFSAPDQAVALGTAAIGLLVLAPVCWMAFLTFARPAARGLTAAFLLANATLLVPTRHPDVIGGIALLLVIGMLVFDRRWLASLPALRTLEGRFVRLLMTVPFIVLVARTFNLYDPSMLFFAALFASLAVLLYAVVPNAGPTQAMGRLAQHMSLMPTAAAWWCAMLGVHPVLDFPEAWVLPIACLPMAGFFGLMSLRVEGGGASVRRLAALVATGGMLVQLLLFPGFGSSLLCLATAIATATYGFGASQRGVLLTGLAALAFGLVYHVRYAFEIYAWSPWGALAVLGIATVLAASVLERHRGALVARVTHLRGELSSWSA